ncbi:MAG TPA: hypothetical protein VMT82_01790 [candidate division Zixibacteria bacterium]|nr:hypothetical protein [candidate division Zixibacteria bacterium]
MTGNSKRVVSISLALLLLCMGASVEMSRKLEAERSGAELQDVMYLPSARSVKALSLGYNGLLADLYWTRVVQYFGSHHHAHTTQYKLLAPLLDITTELDPQLITAYEFGSIFLAQAPPEGAGDPRAAAKLVEKGIERNPTAWRLYYHLGYIQWMELHDSKLASESFQKGSEIPGALPWMKVMAAALAQHAGEYRTATYLWANILNSTTDKYIRDNAEKRLRALKCDEEVRLLQEYITKFTDATGHPPTSWDEMLATGWIKRVPVDPVGKAFKLMNGRVQVADPEKLPFITRGLPPGKESNVLPKLPKQGETRSE